MKKLLFMLAFVWAVVACQPPESSIGPTESKPGNAVSHSARLTAPVAEPTDQNPTTNAQAGGVFIFYSCRVGTVAYGQKIKYVKLNRLNIQTGAESLLKTFTVPFNWNYQDGHPPISLLNSYNSLFLSAFNQPNYFQVRCYNGAGQQICFNTLCQLEVEPGKKYFFNM